MINEKKKKEIGTHELRAKCDASMKRITKKGNSMVNTLNMEEYKLRRFVDKFNMNDDCKTLLRTYFKKIRVARNKLLEGGEDEIFR